MNKESLDKRLKLDNVRDISDGLIKKSRLIDTLYEETNIEVINKIRALNKDYIDAASEIINASGKLIKGQMVINQYEKANNE